jgi:hypothetical protein
MQKVNNATDPRMQLAFSDSCGNKWFTYVNPLEVDAVRGIAAETADRYVEMKICRADLKNAIDAIKKKAKEMEIVDAFAIVHDIGFRNEMLCEANSLLDLAGIYFLLQDEPPHLYLDAFTKKKHEIWAKDPVCRAFFLRMGLGLTKRLSNMSEDDSLIYMEKTKTVSERLYRHIPSPGTQQKNTNDTSTD